MAAFWGIHNDQSTLDLVGENFISVGWDEVGDLHQYTNDRVLLKERIAAFYPDAKAGAIPVWAGVLHRFAFEIQSGDFIVAPQKSDSTINLGRVQGEYYWDGNAEFHRNRRKVEWIQVGIPRITVSQSARNEIGSAVTLFRVQRNEAEFLALLGIKTEVVTPDNRTADDIAIETAAGEPNAEQIESHARDFIIKALHQAFSPVKFEQFIAALLRAMGYNAKATQASGDGGVDVIAHRDQLGLEPPIVKVQCKRTLDAIGGPHVQNLVGTLAPGGAEVGLFITLGKYATDAIRIERTRQDLRLINGTELVDLIFAHYEQLEDEWRRLLPLRRVYVVDRDSTEA